MSEQNIQVGASGVARAPGELPTSPARLDRLGGRRHRVAAAVATLLLAAGAAPAVGAEGPPDGGRTDEFAGNCRFQGPSTIDPVGSFHSTFHGECTGRLNGSVVIDAPLRVLANGTFETVAGPLLILTGRGNLVIGDPSSAGHATIPFEAYQAAFVGHISGRDGGDAIVAAAPAAPPDGSTVEIIGDLQTLTPLRG